MGNTPVLTFRHLLARQDEIFPSIPSLLRVFVRMEVGLCQMLLLYLL